MKKFHMIGILTVILAWVASTPADVFWANTGTDFNSASSFTNLAGAAQAPTSSDFVYFASCAVTQPILTSNLTIKGFGFSLSNNYATATNDGFNGYNFSGYNFTAQNGAKLTLGNSGSAFAILSHTTLTLAIHVHLLRLGTLALLHDGENPGHLTPQLADPDRLFQLARRLLHAKVEQLLLRVVVFLTQLVFRQLSVFTRLHAHIH